MPIVNLVKSAYREAFADGAEAGGSSEPMVEAGWRNSGSKQALSLESPEKKFNSMFDVGFTIEHDYEDVDKIPDKDLVIACMKRLISIMEAEENCSDVFGHSDTYENEAK